MSEFSSLRSTKKIQAIRQEPQLAPRARGAELQIDTNIAVLLNFVQERSRKPANLPFSPFKLRKNFSFPDFSSITVRCITVSFVRRGTATLEGKMWLYDMLNSLYRPNSISRGNLRLKIHLRSFNVLVYSLVLATWFVMHCQCFFSPWKDDALSINVFFSLERRCIVKTERIVDQAWSLRIRKENKLVSLPVKMKVW